MNFETMPAALLRLAAVWLAASSLTGCNTYSPIIVEDRVVFTPSFRVSVNLDDQRVPSEPEAGGVFEFALVNARGSADQSLAAGEKSISFGNVVFNAPQKLRSDFDLRYADFTLRNRGFFGESPVGYELAIGLDYSSLDLTVRTPTQQASRRIENTRVGAGYGLLWRMAPGSSLHFRHFIFMSIGTAIVKTELFFAQTLGKNASIRAGYGYLGAGGQGWDSESDYSIDSLGPTIEFGLHF